MDTPSRMLQSFKLKPFDLEPIYAAWPLAPVFVGKPKKDMPVDQWLEAIKTGCKERGVPKEYWHKVAQHYMQGNAKNRLEELKRVMAKVHGGKYRWNWKRFKTAMLNMGWTIDNSAAETVKVHTKSTGFWWVTRKVDSAKAAEPEMVNRPVPTRSQSLWLPRRKSVVDRQASLDTGKKATANARPPVPHKAKSDGIIARAPSSSSTENVVTSEAKAPIWLINACNALDFLNKEHPKAMSTLGAILITVGTIPSIPAIAAGAGGVVLASSVVQAVGAIAVGVGTALQNSQKAIAQAGHGPSR